MCKSVVELEYHLEEVFKATNDQLDWHNLKGRPYPHDLSKPLPLVPDTRGHLIILYDHFINNDLEYFKGGSSSHKYTTSITKTKAANYGYVKSIEDKILKSIWSEAPIGKLTNLNVDEQFSFNVALRMFTKHDIERNRLMRIDELYKFNDNALNHVRTSLNDIATGIQMEYLPKKK
ncbi:hypothetical protein Tco_0868860 [Tanacetum coccineum]